MLTAAQKRAVNGFAKSLVALGDDALIDAHHQAWEDYRDARTEGGDIVDKAYAQSLRDQNRDAGSLPGLSKLLQAAIPVSQLVPIGSPAPQVPVAAAGKCASMRFLEFLAANIHNPHT